MLQTKTTCIHFPNELLTSPLNMLCDVCIGMLTRRTGLIMTGTLDLVFEHHKSTKTLRESVGMDCPICTRLAQMLSQDTDLSRDQPVAIRAYLKKASHTRDGSNGYEFTLDLELGKGRRCHFLLAKIGIATLTFHMMLY